MQPGPDRSRSTARHGRQRSLTRNHAVTRHRACPRRNRRNPYRRPPRAGAAALGTERAFEEQPSANAGAACHGGEQLARTRIASPRCAGLARPEVAGARCGVRYHAAAPAAGHWRECGEEASAPRPLRPQREPVRRGPSRAPWRCRLRRDVASTPTAVLASRSGSRGPRGSLYVAEDRAFETAPGPCDWHAEDSAGEGPPALLDTGGQQRADSLAQRPGCGEVRSRSHGSWRSPLPAPGRHATGNSPVNNGSRRWRRRPR